MVLRQGAEAKGPPVLRRPGMPGRIEVLAFLQECASRMRQIATGSELSVGAQLRIIADEIAHEASHLEAELIQAGLLDAGLGPGPMRPS